MGRDLLIVGLNHRTTPVALRERLAFADAALPVALGELKAVAGVQEAAILSTCNRVEVVAGITTAPAAAAMVAVRSGRRAWTTRSTPVSDSTSSASRSVMDRS